MRRLDWEGRISEATGLTVSPKFEAQLEQL
jgi:hypothetical protein